MAFAGTFLAACLFDIQIQDRYFQLSIETPRQLILLSALLVIGAVLLACVVRRRVESASCLPMLATSWALTIWFALVMLPMIGVWQGVSVQTQVASLVAICSIGCLSMADSVEKIWNRFGPLVCSFVLLFTIAQPLLAYALGTARYWPPPPPTGSLDQGARLVDYKIGNRGATVFLLLDELSVEFIEGFRADLLAAGFYVDVANVRAESDRTAEVIPAMLTGLSFKHARACSSTAICSGSTVLDFQKVTVTRLDVDIVGFFHPYCEMTGLRSCSRVSASIDLLDAERWSCSVRRRIGLKTDANCRESRYSHWLKLRDGVVRALWQMPFWQEGGMLYAHVPLPHPPGSNDRGTLEQDYASNIVQARDLVRQMVVKLKSGGFDNIQLALFSDHPLRPGVWCHGSGYPERDCVETNRVTPDRVPVMVASSSPLKTDLTKLSTNRDIFQLRVAPQASSPLVTLSP